MGQDSGARLGGCVLWEGGFSRDRKQQNAGFRRLRASFLHTTIINLRAEIKDPRAKEIIDSARKRFPGAAHGQPPPTAGKMGRTKNILKKLSSHTTQSTMQQTGREKGVTR
ncbi:uncharacterized protein LOC135302994 isoform X6 [Passer domesticus]|uniref:uncharacterized protein LOC135302994 isoform X6 n=1 Tax=Passer domesticus TaxID=48849 RepID=UPI0030FED021